MTVVFTIDGFAQLPVPKPDSMVQSFYAINNKPLYWFSSRKSAKRAAEWLTAIELADNMGIVTNKIQIEYFRMLLHKKSKIGDVMKQDTDKEITGMVLNFLKELQEGNVRFDYDEVRVSWDSVYIQQLFESRSHRSVSEIVSSLDCKDHDYMVLKKYLLDSVKEKDSFKYKTVLLAMNYRRYLSMNHQSEYIVTNIPATEAEYYQNDMPVLRMRTVVGKKSKPTPTIASNVTSIVTFPYWNVPYSIAVNEILPKVQKNENYLEQNNYEVVDAKGEVVDESELKWDEYHERYFPYFFRQSTGADNALGVLKFNLHNPFSIFLHSTSWQGAFAKDYRFLSHGCIRLEKPFELADAMLKGEIDIDELKSGKKNTESKIIQLPKKIPVFIIYVPVKVNGNEVVFLQDIYKLIN